MADQSQNNNLDQYVVEVDVLPTQQVRRYTVSILQHPVRRQRPNKSLMRPRRSPPKVQNRDKKLLARKSTAKSQAAAFTHRRSVVDMGVEIMGRKLPDNNCPPQQQTENHKGGGRPPGFHSNNNNGLEKEPEGVVVNDMRTRLKQRQSSRPHHREPEAAAARQMRSSGPYRLRKGVGKAANFYRI